MEFRNNLKAPLEWTKSLMLGTEPMKIASLTPCDFKIDFPIQVGFWIQLITSQTV